MKTLLKTCGLILAVFILTNCASIVSKTQWPLSINTNPSGAKLVITDRNNIEVFIGTTPASVVLKSGAAFFQPQSYKIKLTMDGFNEKIIPVDCTLNEWYIGNCLIGGVIGWLIVDPATGAMYKLDREFVNETLTKSTVDLEHSLKILDINDVPKKLKDHLVALK